MNNILINNGTLGRQGKTTLAYTLYQQLEGFKYVTNDLRNASVDLKKLVADGDLISLAKDGDIVLEEDDKHIFDFGGIPERRTLAVAKCRDLIIIPITYQSKNEIKITVENINAFRSVNNNIIIVPTQTLPEDLKDLKFALSIHPELDFPVYEISHSKYVRRLSNIGQSVFDVADNSKSDAARLKKKIIPQFQAIIDLVKGK